MAYSNTSFSRFLNGRQLADRWGKSCRTIEGWRLRGVGPAWVRIGKTPMYPEEAVEAYERAHLVMGEGAS